MKFPLALVMVAAVAASASAALAQQARDQIRIVGSSTVYPFSAVVAENFGKLGKFKTPIVESTGTGGGLKLFCAGVGTQLPDITNASRPITPAERDACKANGVTEIAEFIIGYDGITLAQNAKVSPFAVTIKQLWLALAKDVPVNGKLAENPFRKWSDVDKALPDREITVFGPASVHGTRDAFNELVMDIGCKEVPEVKALPAAEQKRACQSMREDGAWVDVSEDYNLVVSKLGSNPDAVGIFGFSFLDQNRDKIKALTINGIEPTFEAIADAKYPVSRPLFFYVKPQHIKAVPGIKEYVSEFLSDKAAGEEGYLTAKGLIPLPKAALKKQREAAGTLGS